MSLIPPTPPFSVTLAALTKKAASLQMAAQQQNLAQQQANYLNQLTSQQAQAMNASALGGLASLQQANPQQQGVNLGQGAYANWTAAPAATAGGYFTASKAMQAMSAWDYENYDGGERLWARRGYSLFRSHETGAFTLIRRERSPEGEVRTLNICSWASRPTRSVLAAMLRWDRCQRMKRGARDPMDGALLGVRWFEITENADGRFITSPIQKTRWESELLVAPEWSDSSAVRGSAGIHAAWPAMSRNARPYIDSDDSHVIAHVRGMGRFVSGRIGWRAEKVIIDTMYLPAPLAARRRVVQELEERYPNITFEEETWTLERLPRSARSSLKRSR